MARAVWVLVEVPVHLLQGKKKAPFQDQVSFGSLWRIAYTSDSGNVADGARSFGL
jgi:hypothetical protein